MSSLCKQELAIYWDLLCREIVFQVALPRFGWNEQLVFELRCFLIGEREVMLCP